MDIKDIKYVITIAETKNFSKAAELLFISQPALSQAINRLENELGVLIFERNKSKVSLSKAGELFLEDGKLVLETFQKLKNKISDLSRAKTSTLKVGVSQFYGKHFLPKVIPTFNSLRPDITIEIIEGHSALLEKKILDSQIDLAIIPLPISSPKIKHDIIHKEEIKFAICASNKRLLEVSDKLSEKDLYDLSIFKNEPFIMLPKGFKMRAIAEAICKEIDFIPKAILETENLDTVNSLVSNNLGVSFLPELISKYDNVKYINFYSNYSSRLMVAAYRNDKYISGKIRDFISTMQEAFQNNPNYE